MSLAGIAATSFLSGVFSPNHSNRSGPIAQEWQQLGQDLQAGNLPAAQSDFTNLRQDVQPGTGRVLPLHHHHHFQESSSGPTGISEVLNQLGQALHSGNIAAAQQSYAALLQDFQAISPGSGTGSNSVPVSGGVSVLA